MKLHPLLAALLAGAATFMLRGCAHAPAMPTFHASTPPSAATAGPAPSRLAAEASVFESYMRHARAIDGRFSSAAEVSQALQTGASSEPQQLANSMIAYGAVAALQEPRFVEGLRSARNRGELARRLATDPNYALQLPGGTAAAARASGALTSQGEALQQQGMKVKRSAYAVQHEAWSKVRNPDPRGRLARVKQLSAASYRASAADSAHLYNAVGEGGRRGGAAGPAATRAVAVAALNVLGEEGRGRALMNEAHTGTCLRFAKLNLYQCLAAAGPEYEGIFCLGQHAMADTGQCIVDATRPGRASTRVSYRR